MHVKLNVGDEIKERQVTVLDPATGEEMQVTQEPLNSLTGDDWATYIKKHTQLSVTAEEGVNDKYTLAELEEYLSDDRLSVSLTDPEAANPNDYTVTLRVPRYRPQGDMIVYKMQKVSLDKTDESGATAPDDSIESEGEFGDNFEEPCFYPISDYYGATYDNQGAVNHGSDTTAVYSGGTMSITHMGNTSYSAWKRWLDGTDKSKRTDTTYTLWRYSSSLAATNPNDPSPFSKAAQVSDSTGKFVSFTVTAAENQSSDSINLGTKLWEKYTDADGNTTLKLAKYDQDGYAYIYLLREESLGDYETVFGIVSEDTGKAADKSLPSYQNSQFDGYVDWAYGENELNTWTRASSDKGVYDGGVITNRLVGSTTAEVTKTWNAAAFQDQLGDVEVTLKVQRKPEYRLELQEDGFYKPVETTEGDWEDVPADKTESAPTDDTEEAPDGLAAGATTDGADDDQAGDEGETPGDEMGGENKPDPYIVKLNSWNAESLIQTASGTFDGYDTFGFKYEYRWVETDVTQNGVSVWNQNKSEEDPADFKLQLRDEDGNVQTVPFKSEPSPDGQTITNSFMNETTIHAQKWWAQVSNADEATSEDQLDTVKDPGQHDGIAWTQSPAWGSSITLKLIRDNDVVLSGIQLGGSDKQPGASWTQTLNDGSGATVTLTIPDDGQTPPNGTGPADPSAWNIDISGLPKYDENGALYRYVLIEDDDEHIYVSDREFRGNSAWDDEGITYLYNAPGPGERSLINVSKQWYNGDNATNDPVKVELRARIPLYYMVSVTNDGAFVSGNSGRPHEEKKLAYDKDEVIATLTLNEDNAWFDTVTMDVGGLDTDLSTIAKNLYIKEIDSSGTVATTTDGAEEARSYDNKVITHSVAAQDSTYSSLLMNWDDTDNDRYLVQSASALNPEKKSYVDRITYGTNSNKKSLEVTNTRIGLVNIDITKDWKDAGSSARPDAMFDLTLNERDYVATFVLDADGISVQIAKSDDPTNSVTQKLYKEVGTTLENSTRLTAADASVSADGHTLSFAAPSTKTDSGALTQGANGTVHVLCLPKYDPKGAVLHWNVAENWATDDVGDYAKSGGVTSEDYTSAWHEGDEISCKFSNERAGTKDVVFNTHWYDQYVKETLDQRIDIFLTLYKTVWKYDENGNLVRDEKGNPVVDRYVPLEEEEYKEYNWQTAETGDNYVQHATISSLPKYDDHGTEIVYYASAHTNTSDNAADDLGYDPQWFTYDESENDPSNNAWSGDEATYNEYPGSSTWDSGENNTEVGRAPARAEDVTAEGVVTREGGDRGNAVREGGTINFRISGNATIKGSKLWQNVPGGVSADNLPEIAVMVTRKLAGDANTTFEGVKYYYNENDPYYTVDTYAKGDTRDYGVQNGSTVIAWTTDLEEKTTNNFEFTLNSYGDNSSGADKDPTLLPRYNRNGAIYEYRAEEVVAGLMGTPGGLQIRDAGEGDDDHFSGADSGGKTYKVTFSIVQEGESGSFSITNVYNPTKGSLKVKKLFAGRDENDNYPTVTFELWRYFYDDDDQSERIAESLVTTATLRGGAVDSSGKAGDITETSSTKGNGTGEVTFDKLDVYAPNGEYWHYYVVEKGIGGYTSAVETYDKADVTVPDTAKMSAGATSEAVTILPKESSDEPSTADAGATPSVNSGDVAFTFKNEYKDGKTLVSLTGTKFWDDANNALDARPKAEDFFDGITLKRVSTATEQVEDNLKLQRTDLNGANFLSYKTSGVGQGESGNPNTYTFEIKNLERWAPDGSEWEYTITETVPKGYYPRGDDGASATVSAPSDEETYTASFNPEGGYAWTNAFNGFVTVKKRWDDGENDYKLRPTKITVELQAKVGEGDTWGAAYDALASYFSADTDYLSKLFEGSLKDEANNNKPTSQYVLTGDASQNDWEMTVGFLPLKVRQDASSTPEDVSYRFVEVAIDGHEVTQTPTTGDTVVYTNAPGSGGTVLSYTTSQETSSPTDVGGKNARTTTITNALDSTSIKLSKTWEDQDNRWFTRPGTSSDNNTWEITIALQRTTGTGDSATWEWAVPYDSDSRNLSNLHVVPDDVISAHYTATGNTSTATIGNLPKSDGAGGTYKYRLVELVPDGYTVKNATLMDVTGQGYSYALPIVTTGNDGIDVSSFTNKWETVSLEGTKVWNNLGVSEVSKPTLADDKSNAPKMTLSRTTDDPASKDATWEDVTELAAGDSAIQWSQESDEDDWTFEYSNLPKCDQHGNAYYYKAEEEINTGAGYGFYPSYGSGDSGAEYKGSDGKQLSAQKNATITNTVTRFTFDKKAAKTSEGEEETSLNDVTFEIRDTVKNEDSGKYEPSGKIATWSRAVDSSGAISESVTIATGDEASSIATAGVVRVQKTDDNKCYIVGLPVGNYWVKETAAPFGYQAADDFMIRVRSGGAVQIYDAYKDRVIGGNSESDVTKDLKAEVIGTLGDKTSKVTVYDSPATITATVVGTKTIDGRVWTNTDKFTFNVYQLKVSSADDAANVTYVTDENGQKKIVKTGVAAYAEDMESGSQNITFTPEFSYTHAELEAAQKAETATYDETDKSWTLQYEIEEALPEGVDPNEDGSATQKGMTYTANPQRIKVVVAPDNSDDAIAKGRLSATVTYLNKEDEPLDEVKTLAFTNKYVATPVTGTIAATKKVNNPNGGGYSLAANNFSFTLTATSDNAKALASAQWNGDTFKTVTNDASGAVAFGDITFKAPGEYKYEVKENNITEGTLNGYPSSDFEKDGSTYTITYEIADDTEGALYVKSKTVIKKASDGKETIVTDSTTNSNNDIVTVGFENTYKPKFTTATLGATKVLTGNRPLAVNDFEFMLTATDGKAADGATAIDVANVPMPKDYDQATHSIKKKNGAPDNNDKATVSFGEIEYTTVGTYTYTISEVAGQLGGVSYDDTTYTATVTVTDGITGDDGNITDKGKLHATVTYTKDGDSDPVMTPAFTNSYKAETPAETPANTNLQISATKALTAPATDGKGGTTNLAIDPNEFSFTMTPQKVGNDKPTDEAVRVMTITKGNDATADGATTVNFGTLSFSTETATTNSGENAGKTAGGKISLPWLVANKLASESEGANDNPTYTITYEVAETSGADTDHIAYSTDKYIVVVTVTDNLNGELSVDKTITKDDKNANGIAFTNTYTPTPVTDTLGITKTVTASNGNTFPKLAGNEFSFTITRTAAPVGAVDAFGMSGNSKVVGNAADVITDGKPTPGTAETTLTFDKPGEYKFTVAENEIGNKVGEYSGQRFSKDTSTYEVTYEVGYDDDNDNPRSLEIKRIEKKTVKKASDGATATSTTTTLKADESPVVDFDNGYDPQNASVTLKAKKQLVGNLPLTAGQFSFTLTATGEQGNLSVVKAEDTPMPGENQMGGTATATNGDPAGNNTAEVVFGSITYTKPGIYCYTITEPKPENAIPGVAYAVGSTYHVTVTVDDVNGTLTPTIKYDGQEYKEGDANADDVLPKFINTYTDTAFANTGLTITGSKELLGRTITVTGGEQVEPDPVEAPEATPGEALDGSTGTDGTALETSGNADGENIVYGAEGADSKTSSGGSPNANGGAGASEDEGSSTDTNTDGNSSESKASASSAAASSAKTVAAGATAAANVVPEARVTQTERTVTFGPLEHQPIDEGEFSFVVYLAGNPDAVVSSATTSASLSGMVDLMFSEMAYTTEEAPTNSTDGIVRIEGGVAVYSLPWLVKKGYATSQDAVDGKSVVYTIDYTAAEKTDSLSSLVTAAEASFNFTVTVTDDLAGNLTAEADYGTNDDGTPKSLAFKNFYNYAQLNLKGSKSMSGDLPLEEGDYTFVLSASDGAPMPASAVDGVATATNDASGNVEFGTVLYDEDTTRLTTEDSVTYIYTVTEQKTDAPGVTIAKAQTFTVTVTRDEDGAFTAKGDGATGTLFSLVNTYTPTPEPSSVTDTFAVTKTLTGRSMADGEFAFDLFELDANGQRVSDTPAATGTNAGTKVEMGDVTFTKAGVYRYELVERNTGTPGVTFDQHPILVTATVTNDFTDATLDVVWSITPAEGDAAGNGGAPAMTDSEVASYLTIANAYAPKPIEVPLAVTKTLAGATLEAGQFTFELYDGEGQLLGTATNAADGSVTFDALRYTEAGEWHYTVREVNDGQHGVTYDASAERRVTVTVTDDGKANLTAEVTGDSLAFANTFTPDTPASTPGASDSSIPQTGDPMPYAVAAVAAVAVGAGAVAGITYRRRKKR